MLEMMVKQKEDYALLLEEIQHKIYLVAKKNQFLREQNQVLQEEIDALKGLFRKKEIQITELKEKKYLLNSSGKPEILLIREALYDGLITGNISGKKTGLIDLNTTFTFSSAFRDIYSILIFFFVVFFTNFFLT